MNKQPELTEQTRANLLEAFWSLYTVKRIDQITVKEIAAKAGYNRGTFYEYFKDVYQCLDDIENMALPRLEELPPLPGATANAPPPEFFEPFIRMYREKFAYYDVLLGERGNPGFQRRLIDGIKASIMNAAQARGKQKKAELDYMLEYVLSGMIGIMRYYFHSRPSGSKAEIMALLYKIMSGDMLQRLRHLVG
jgi:AcrR family transcriptional regulator